MKKNTSIPDIIIADIQMLIIEGLKSLLHGRCHINCSVSTKYELQKALQNKVPRLLIVDFSLLDFDGIDDLQEIKKNYPAMGIIILTSHFSSSDLKAFNNIGIRNILHKSLDHDELFNCIDSALKNKKYYSNILLELLLDEKKNADHGSVQLTASEIEIVRLIAEGLTTKEIAQRKFLSFHTIMTHRKNIFRKAGVSNVSELIRFAIKQGIIDNIEYHI